MKRIQTTEGAKRSQGAICVLKEVCVAKEKASQTWGTEEKKKKKAPGETGDYHIFSEPSNDEENAK